MDWNAFWLTFGAIFMAELGDKTQLGVLSLAASGKSPWTVFVAAVLALTAASALGVLAGQLLSRHLNPQTMKITSGTLFVLIGFWILTKKG